jgi:hypothetical protein
MKRSFSSIFDENLAEGYEPGDQAAQIAAGALAQRLDAPTIGRILDMVSLLETVGGQFYITPLRVQSEFDPGAYEVTALVFNYETRDIKVQRLEAPDEIQGLPVTGSHEEGVRIEVGEPEVDPEPEVDAEPEPGAEMESEQPEYPVEV